MRVDWQLNILYWIHNSSSWTKTDVLNCKLPTIWDNFHCRIYDLLILNVVDYATKNGPNLQPTIYDFPLLLAQTKTKGTNLDECLYRLTCKHPKKSSEWKPLQVYKTTHKKEHIWMKDFKCSHAYTEQNKQNLNYRFTGFYA